MSKVAIFASGEGSNADQIMSYFANQTDGIVVSLLVCNKSEAPVVQKARQHKVDVLLVTNNQVEDDYLMLKLTERRIQWIVLAGFLRKIPIAIIRQYENRIINLHPSLLPKFGGKGMYGQRVHRAVIEQSEKESGITIHFVNEEYDKGKIIAQFSCALETNESVTSLQEKIHRLEHLHFSKVIHETINKVKHQGANED